VLAAVAGGTALGTAVYDATLTASAPEPSSAVSSEPERLPEQATTSSGVFRALERGRIALVASGLDATAAIDPTRTRTPVQDALDTVSQAGGGRVLLPPKPVTEQESISVQNGVSVRGYWGSSEIVFSEGTDGIIFDPNSSQESSLNYIIRAEIDGVTLRAPENSPPSAVGIRDYGLWLSRFGRIELDGWSGVAWKVERDANSFENTFGYVLFSDCDAGNTEGLLHWNSGGAPNRFGTIAAYPNDRSSGTNSTILNGRGIRAWIGVLNVGGTAGPIFSGRHNGLSVDIANWEPSRQNSTPDAIFDILDQSSFRVGQLTVQGRTSHAYSGFRAGGMFLPRPEVTQSGTIEESVLHLETPPYDHIFYYGPTEDVSTVSSDTGLCHCIGSFASVG